MPCLALPGLTLHGPSWPNFELAFLRFLGLPGFAWPCQAVLCPPWPGLDLCGLALPCLGWPCLDWPCIALLCLFLHGLVLPCVAWPCLALSGLAWPGLAFLFFAGSSPAWHGHALPCLALPCVALVYLHSPYLAWTGLEIFFNPASLGLSCSGVDFLGMSGLALRFLLIP